METLIHTQKATQAFSKQKEKEQALQLEVIGTEENAEEQLLSLETTASVVLGSGLMLTVAVITMFIYSYM